MAQRTKSNREAIMLKHKILYQVTPNNRLKTVRLEEVVDEVVVDELLAERRVAIHLARDPPQHQPLLQLVVLRLDADVVLFEQNALIGDVSTADQLLVKQRVVLVLNLVHLEQESLGRVKFHIIDEYG